MKGRWRSAGRRSGAAWVAAWTLALAAAAAAAAGQGDGGQDGQRAIRIDQRTDVRAELTASDTAATLLNPGGRVSVADSVYSRFRTRSELVVRLPAATGFKSAAAFQVLDGAGDGTDLDFRLLEAYLHRPFGPAVLSVGRKILRWTNGYAFAPAGLVDPARDPADPQDRLGQLEGRDVVTLDVYAGSHSFSAAYTPGKVLPASKADHEELLAFRYNLVVGTADVSLMAAHRPDSVDSVAASASTVLGPALELHAEASLSRGSPLSLPRSSLAGSEHTLYDPADFYAPLRLLDRRLYARWMLGFNFTLPGGANLIAEYLHAPDGLSAAEWERVLGQARFSSRQEEAGASPPIFDGRTLPELNLLMAQRSLGGGSLGRHYGFLRLAQTGILGRIDASVLAYANLQDVSLAIVPEVSAQLQRRVTLYGRASFFSGAADTEFGNVPLAYSATLGVRVAF